MDKKECIEIFERYILNSASAHEISILSKWIRENKELSNWLEKQILESDSHIDKELQLRMFRNIESATEFIQDETPQKVKSFGIRKWIQIAAMFFLPLVTAAGVYLYMSGINYSAAPLVVSVERGQKANITLPDGSKVWLNSQSKLTYTNQFNDKNRELNLDGEAYFKVAHNPQKPFIVKSKDIQVEAIGTSFCVKSYENDKSVSSILLEGKVRVSTPAGSSILMPNERIFFDRTSAKNKKTTVTNASDFTGWINNQLRFENESLYDIAQTIQRVYNVEIEFSSESIKNQRFTGTVYNNSLENVLNIITITSPVSFRISDNKVSLFENKKH